MTSTLSPMAPQRRAAVRSLLVEQVTAAAGRTPVVRSSRRRLALLRIGAVSTAAAAIVALVLVAADPAAPPSYASWSAVPQTAPGALPDTDVLQDWASKCSDLKVGGVAIEGVGARRAEARRRSVLVDRRGTFTYCVDVSVGNGTEKDPLIALSGIRDDAGGLNRMWATVDDQPFQAPVGKEAVVLGGDLKPPPAETPDPDVTSLQACQVYGLAGPEVDGIEVVLTNGLRITATVKDGIWGAWWPIDRGDPTGMQIVVGAAGSTRTFQATELAK